MRTGMTTQEFAAELQRIENVKEDYVLDSRNMEMQLDGLLDQMIDDAQNANELDPPVTGKPVLRVGDVGTFGIKPLAHEQIATRLKIPKQYYDRMRVESPALLAQNVNYWLGSEPAKRMVRTLDGEVRAVLSSRYRRLDAFGLMTAILPELSNLGSDLRIESTMITDRKTYFKATFPRLQGEVRPGDVVRAGIVVQTSEVGCGKEEVLPLLLRLICMNGATINMLAHKRIHIGRNIEVDDDTAERLYSDEAMMADDRAHYLKVRDVVRGLLNPDNFEKWLQEARRSTTDRVEAPVDTVVERLTNRYALTEAAGGSILNLLAQSGDMTRWGLLNAVTAYSQTVTDYDEASTLEEVGGQILTLPKTDWAALAKAA